MRWRYLLIPAGGWAAINGLWYAADFDRGYRAESAWIIFGCLLMISAVAMVLRERNDAPGLNAPDAETPLFWLAAFVAAAIALYIPALSIGLLSDDFVLLTRARSGSLADAQWEYLRPLPLAIWQAVSALESILDVPLALHLLNVVLHGANTWLVLRLAVRLGITSRSALLAAALFLVFPAAVETVAWASGIFDVLLTTLTLAACLVATAPGRLAWLRVSILTAAAVLTKEAGVMLPVLAALAVCATPRPALGRAVALIAPSLAVVAVYVAGRLVIGFAGAPPVNDVSGYAIKEIVSRPFGALAMPFHVDVLSAHRWIPYLLALVWPALFVFGADRWTSLSARQILCFAGWILFSIAPLATMFFVGGDLQGSRWVYIGSVAWCLVPVVLLRDLSRRVQSAIVVPLILLFAAATVEHQSAWVDAAAERDRVLAAYRNSALNCVPQHAEGVPDHVRGAYVFRNGLAEAIARELPAGTPSCLVTFDGSYFSIRSPR